MHNEIGVIQPIPELSAVCDSRGITMHTDAAQAYGHLPLHAQGYEGAGNHFAEFHFHSILTTRSILKIRHANREV